MRHGPIKSSSYSNLVSLIYVSLRRGYTPQLKSKAAQGEDLWILSEECIALLESSLLRDLGFDAATAFQLSAATRRFQLLLNKQGKLGPAFTVSTADNHGAGEATAGGKADDNPE
jgi:hypothetical protein